MTKLVQKENEYKELVDECRALLSELRFDLEMKNIEWHHLLGKTIIESRFYQQYAKGSGEFIQRLARDIGLSKSLVYQCCEFYRQFPNLSTLVETSTGKKILKWSDIRLMLTEAKRECEHQETEEEEIVITRIRCVKCSKILKETKQNKI